METRLVKYEFGKLDLSYLYLLGKFCEETGLDIEMPDYYCVVSDRGENVGLWVGSVIREYDDFRRKDVPRPVLFSEGLYVVENRRREGVGLMMKSHQVEIARELKIPCLCTTVKLANEKGLSLQKKIGATVVKDMLEKNYFSYLMID